MSSEELLLEIKERSINEVELVGKSGRYCFSIVCQEDYYGSLSFTFNEKESEGMRMFFNLERDTALWKKTTYKSLVEFLESRTEKSLNGIWLIRSVINESLSRGFFDHLSVSDYFEYLPDCDPDDPSKEHLEGDIFTEKCFLKPEKRYFVILH